jgi:hypothetical protein
MTKKIKILISLGSLLLLLSIGFILLLGVSGSSDRVTNKFKQLIRNNTCSKEYPLPQLKYLPNDKLIDYKDEVRVMGVQPVKTKANLKGLIKKQKLVPVPLSNWAYALKIKDKEMRYVVPKTRTLLYQITNEFKKRISKSDLYNAKLKITSLFRLKGNNPKNSSAESAHKNGCAFDISYIEFLNQSDEPMELDHCEMEYLQLSLEKVIEEIQSQGKLYKTKEFGATSKCFHIVPKR